VKDIIRQLIDEGKLQEGLVDCTDKRLWRDSRVLTCDLLGDAVCQLITNGDICLVKPEALTVEKLENGSHKISLLMSDGTKLDTTARLTDGVLNSVTYDAKTKIAKFTTTNGDSYEIKLDIPEPIEYTFTKKDDGVYSIAKDGTELLAINPGVLDVKIEGDKLHVTNAAGEVKQFDIPMPTVTPTELTNNGDGTGSVKYGDVTLPVMTKPTTATKAEDGTVTITNSNGTEVTMTIPNCPDTLLVDAFDKVEVGYIHSATCDKSELEKDPEPEGESVVVYVRRVFDDGSDAGLLDTDPDINSKPTSVEFNVRSSLPAGITGIDAPLTVRFTSIGMRGDDELFRDVYTATIPAGGLTFTVPYKTHPDSEFTSSFVVGGTLEVVSYDGKYRVLPSDIENTTRSIDRL
jgi:hypothetical protein